MPKQAQTYFQPWWLDDQTYKPWIKRCPTDDKVFICTYCNRSKQIALSNMGERALKSHMKGEKHTRIAKQRESGVGEVFLLNYMSPNAVVNKSLQSGARKSADSPFLRKSAYSPFILRKSAV